MIPEKIKMCLTLQPLSSFLATSIQRRRWRADSLARRNRERQRQRQGQRCRTFRRISASSSRAAPVRQPLGRGARSRISRLLAVGAAVLPLAAGAALAAGVPLAECEVAAAAGDRWQR